MAKKYLSYRSVCAAILGVALVSAPQAAQAQIPVTDVLSLAALQQIIQALGGQMGVTNTGQKLQSELATKNADAVILNAKNNLDAQAAQKIAIENARPAPPTSPTSPTISSCGIRAATASGGTSKGNGGAVAQAMAMANNNRPDDPVTNAQQIKARGAMNFTPPSTSTSDPDASAYAALGASGSDPHHAHTDETVEALLGKIQFRVDKALKLVNNAYQPLTAAPSDPGYYDFDAALSYCQLSTPPQPVAPQAPGGKATAQLLAMGPVLSARAAISIGSGTCYKLLEERMQYGPEVDQTLQNRYKDQSNRCMADMKANIINADQNSRCQQYGRSDLQADYDLAYRLGSDPNSAADVPYQTVVLPNVKPDTEQILIAMAWSDQQKFEERLTMERLTMAMASNAANGVAHSISPVSSSALSQPVTTK